MHDRCLFLQDEIACAYVDDWLVLPAEPVFASVYAGVSDAVARHDALFELTH